jgi:hypothetical protein
MAKQPTKPQIRMRPLSDTGIHPTFKTIGTQTGRLRKRIEKKDTPAQIAERLWLAARRHVNPEDRPVLASFFIEMLSKLVGAELLHFEGQVLLCESGVTYTVPSKTTLCDSEECSEYASWIGILGLPDIVVHANVCDRHLSSVEEPARIS